MENNKGPEREFLKEAIKIIKHRIEATNDVAEKAELQKALGYMETVLESLEHGPSS